MTGASVEQADGTTLHAMLPTRTTHVPFASSRLKSQERPFCTVAIEHRTRWRIERSGFAPQIGIDPSRWADISVPQPRRLPGRPLIPCVSKVHDRDRKVLDLLGAFCCAREPSTAH
jgi:hypothetical protein